MMAQQPPPPSAGYDGEYVEIQMYAILLMIRKGVELLNSCHN